MAYRSEMFDDPNQHEDNVRRRSRNQRFADKAAFHGINWDYYAHHELYDMIMSANVGTMGQRAQTWKQVADGIRATTDDVQRTIQRMLNSWTGAAAVTAGASITRLTQWADEANDRATRIAAGLTRYTEAVELAQHKMPPPEFAYAKDNFTQGFDVKGTGGPSTAILIAQLLSDQEPNFKKHQEAHAEAVQVMRIYASGSQEAHNSTPGLPTPPPGGPGPGPLDDPGRKEPPQRVPPLPIPPDPKRPPGPGTGVTGDLDGDRIPDGTTPEGYTTTGPGTGFVGGPGGGSGADVPRGGGPGSGGFVGGGGMSGGGPLAAKGGLPGRGPGGAGGPGLFPGGAAGARGQGEEDLEHKTKFVEGEDWLDDDLPPFSNGVIGAW